jgi:hypothetical protein
VHLVAYVTSYRDLHGYELAVEAGMKDLPELPELTHFLCEALEVDELVWRRCIL